MSKQLHSAMTEILKMPYFKNEQAHSGGANYGHEEAVAIRFRSAGFAEVDKAEYPKITKSMLKKWSQTGDDTALRKATVGLPVGSFILQPSGSQGFPDVLVLDFNNLFVGVECKSAKSGCPQWNDSLPHPNSIYVVTSGDADATTIFMGRDVISTEELALRDTFIAEVRELVNKYKTTMTALDFFERGWVLGCRPKFSQAGGGVKANYFTHPKRSACEKLALEYARQ